MPLKYLITACAALILLGQGCAPTVKPPTDVPPGQTSESNTCNVAKLAESIMTDRTEGLLFPGILPKEETNKIIRIKTAKGDIVFELLPDEGPCAASNFVYLTKNKFYDGLTFHRREPWVLQGGDPLGDGYGDPGYKFKNDKVNLPYTRGVVAMANSGVNTNGSQFFIMVADTPLDPDYSIFGRVIEGLDVVDALGVGDVMESVTIEDRVVEDAVEIPTSTDVEPVKE